MVAVIVLCVPTHGDHSELAYLTALDSPKCSDSKPIVILLGVVSLLSDLYLVILPLPAVRKLQLPFRRKLAFGGVLHWISVRYGSDAMRFFADPLKGMHSQCFRISLSG